MDILMPQLGETVAEGRITKWFKQPGDEIKPGDNLFEIETDKTSMEVPSTTAGRLTVINVQAGEVAKVGTVVAVIGGDRAAATPATKGRDSPSQVIPAKAEIQSRVQDSRLRASERESAFAYPHMDPFREVRTPEKNYGPARVGGRQVTPLARRLAGERGIDLGKIEGTGPRGRIFAADIESAAPQRAAGGGPTAAQVKALYEGIAYQEIPLDPMRAAIAGRLVEAQSTIPQLHLTADIEIDRLLAMRDEANAAAPRNSSGEAAFRLSLNDFIIKAWAAALHRVPAANAVWAADRILRFRSSDVGVAVALDGGLVTPVVRNAELKSLTAISAEMRELAARARDRKLAPAAYQGGATAISNLGMYGVRDFVAIVNPPHATMLAVGASRRAPVEADDGSVRFISAMSVTLSCDHRVLDGATGARLLAAFKALMENPITALI